MAYPFKLILMKRTIVLLLALMISLVSFSQFNESFNTTLNEKSTALLNIDNTIFYAFTISDSLNHKYMLRYELYKVSNTGTILDSLVVELDSGYTWINTLKGIDDAIYMVCFRRGGIDPLFPPQIKIARINFNLEIEVDKEYIIGMDFISSLHSFFNEQEMLLVVHGRIDGYADQVQRDKIFRVGVACDTLSSVIPEFRGTIKIKKIPNEESYYVTSAYHNYFIMKTDLQFNVLQMKYTDIMTTYQSRYYFDENNVDLTAIVNETPTYWGNPYAYSQIGIIQLDTSFNENTYERIYYGDMDVANYLSDYTAVKSSTKGHFIASVDNINWELFTDTPNKITVRNYSNDLAFVWERIISSPDTSFYIYSLLDAGNGILLSGSKYCTTDVHPNCDVFIYKFEYNGNFAKIFERKITAPQINVYPNPGTNFFNVDLMFDAPNCELLMFDIAGREVLRKEIKQNTERINAAALARGTYTYSILKEGKALNVGKWVKQ